ncbi:phospholipase [Hyphobacterium sp. HN65]|uniref:Phospholipase n=1 Tax=Hyphobacterium lacteum TaxID=3116575 RepID=A0ABU7LQ51_9PROT|nr:phospholipase [Hyphobacterium sp. HN65]MEE2526018.1 phospholipase [Hyphobacterium sp. HN65]
MMIDGPRQPPANGQKPRKLVILVHGYGANGEDLIGLAGQWARDLPYAQFVSPNAPEPVPGAPNGYQWFPITRLDPEEANRGVEMAAPILNTFIDQELTRYGLTDNDLALVGFSQGTMMSLHCGLRRSPGPAGILGYSGAMPSRMTLKEQIRCKPAIQLIHGDRDDVLPLGMMFDAAEGLAEAGASCQWHISPGVPHGIGPDGLDIGGRFLGKVFSGAYA